MWGLLISAGIILGEYVYHNWSTDKPKQNPANTLSIPRVDDGAPYPLLYGRCRVKAPVIAWCDKPLFGTFPFIGDPGDRYYLSMMLVLGIPFDDGEHRLLSMYSGDTAMSSTGATQLSDLVGDGTDFTVPRHAGVSTPGPRKANGDPLRTGSEGFVEFFNGDASQRLVDVGSGTPLSEAGRHMTQSLVPVQDPWSGLFGTIAVGDVPGYRGFLSAFLYSHEDGVTADPVQSIYHWIVGSAPSVPQYSFEAQSLPSTFLGPRQQVAVLDGDITRDAGDANPMDVVWDLLTGKKAKLGLDPSLLDRPSFAAAAATLDAEGNGYSNSLETAQKVIDAISGVMRQVDGVFYWEPRDGKLYTKLIRNDYDPATLLVVSPANCEGLQNFAAGGNTDLPNRIRITFRDRANNYNDNSAVSPDEANVLGQSGEVREIQIRMDGVCELATANAIAARELAAQCRPLIKCRAIVDRSFRLTRPGGCVMLKWPDYNLSGVVMRVANVDLGTLQSGKITLDLIQDHYYVWRTRPPVIVGARFLGGAVRHL